MHPATTSAAATEETKVTIAKEKRRKRIDWQLVILALLITSYFYVLPLGRFSLGGFLSDFRLYDVMFVLFFVTVGLRRAGDLRRFWRDSYGFFRWSIFLLYLVWMSIGTSYFVTLDSTMLLPTLIRAFRFTSYFLAAGYVLLLVRSHTQQQMIILIFFANITIQALLGFVQGTGSLPSFWPDYWLANYGFRPVGTLSPHHKQMGIVMIMGIGLCIGWLLHTRGLRAKIVTLTVFAVMATVPLLAGSRTAWLGYAGMVVGAAIVIRGRMLLGGAVVVLFLAIVAGITGDAVTSAISESVETRFIDRIERFGFEGIAGERLPIYSSFLENIADYPHVLLLGTGFQNVDFLVAGTGAHNNFLQALIELGIPGLWIFVTLLIRIWQSLRRVSIHYDIGTLQRSIADGVAIAFSGIVFTMLVGETLWAQYSMFTLTGQIMTLVAVTVAPLYWTNQKVASAVMKKSRNG